MEAVLLRGLDQSASRATSSVERANEKLGIEYSSRPTWTHQADRREAERRTPRTARPAARATSRGLTPLARPRVRTSARAKRALGDRACLIMRISSSSAWTRPRTSLWRGIAHLEAGYHRRRGVLLHFHNFNYKPYWIEPYLPGVREYIQSGGALAMIGGDLSFASGQYGESALRDVLPVDVAGIPAEGPRAFSTDSFKPRLTAAGRNHPVTSLSLDPRANEARWAALPQLQEINRVARLQPGATALLVHPGQAGTRGQPAHRRDLVAPVALVSRAGPARQRVDAPSPRRTWVEPTPPADATRTCSDPFADNPPMWRHPPRPLPGSPAVDSGGEPAGDNWLN